MADSDQDTAAFLASTTAFLDSYCVDSVAGQITSEISFETEHLHSLWSSNTPGYQEKDDGDLGTDQTSSTSSTCTSDGSDDIQMSSQIRREIYNAQAAVRRNRYREKQKLERELLRSEGVELTAQLNRLQTMRREEKARHTGMLALSAWKSVAMRQKEKRREAERTQRELKSLVISRFKLISKMNVLLQSRFAAIPAKVELSAGGACSGAYLIDVYLTELDSYYAQTDQITRDVHFTMASTLKYDLTKISDQGVEVFSTACKTFISFGYEGTCAALSKILLAPGGSCYNNVTVKSNNTVALNYQQKYEEGLHSSKVVAFIVRRRYEHTSRTVFVLRAFLEGKDELDGFQSDETAWLVVQRHGDYHGTELKLYVRLVRFPSPPRQLPKQALTDS